MTNTAPLEEFGPAKLQDGLLMAVENVHETLRYAREKHRVMVGNPDHRDPWAESRRGCVRWSAPTNSAPARSDRRSVASGYLLAT
jgi:hypothetical protein